MTRATARDPKPADPKTADPGPRATKLTGDELADQARQAIIRAHAQPRYDLTVEPWIPVLRHGGTVAAVGLRELLTDAHRIIDLAVPHPLLRASLRRFLSALTADVVRSDRASSQRDWELAHRTDRGFSSGQVEQLLRRHGAHLYLWHPVSPFLQDRRLVAALVKPQADQAIHDLVLDLPTSSSAAWWVKAGEPALNGGQDPADTTLWLLARWFYAANGNCGDVRLPDGGTVGAHSGGAFAETVATVTHAFRVDGSSLFRTLLRGLPQSLIPTRDAGTDGCAWLDLDQPRPSADPLYQATLNPAAALLTAADPAGHVTRFVRTSTPLPGEDAKKLRNIAMDADQHRITTPSSATGSATGKASVVRVLPGAQRSEALRVLYRDGLEAHPLRGVVSSADCWLPASGATFNAEQLDLLLVSKGGTGSSPVWEYLAGLALPARHVDPAHPDGAVAVGHVRAAVKAAFDPTDGVLVRLDRAMRELLGERTDAGWAPARRDSTPGRTASTLTAAAYERWQLATANEFAAVLDSSPGNAQALAAWSATVWSAALDAYDQEARPYLSSVRYAPRYAAARRRLIPRSAP